MYQSLLHLEGSPKSKYSFQNINSIIFTSSISIQKLCSVCAGKGKLLVQQFVLSQVFSFHFSLTLTLETASQFLGVKADYVAEVCFTLMYVIVVSVFGRGRERRKNGKKSVCDSTDLQTGFAERHKEEGVSGMRIALIKRMHLVLSKMLGYFFLFF